MKTTIRLAAIAAATAFLLSSTASMPALAGGLHIDKPIFVELPDNPVVKPDTRPGQGDGEWHVEHDEPDDRPTGGVEGTQLGGPDHPQDEPQGEDDNDNNDEGGDVADKVAEVSCVIWEDTEFLGGVMDLIQIYNTGNTVLTAGTLVEVVLGDGTVYEWIVPADTVPGGSWALYSTLQGDFPADTGLSHGDCVSDIIIA